MKSISDMKVIRERGKASLALRSGCVADISDETETAGTHFRSHVMVCAGTGCTAGRSEALIEGFKKCLAENGLENEVAVVRTGCFGLCAQGPVVVVYPEGVFYRHIRSRHIPNIVESHLKNGIVVKELVYEETLEQDGRIRPFEEVDFYAKQQRLVLRNCGLINPDCIDEYIANDGYLALETCLTAKTPSEVVAIVKASGLRGRGGAGFSAGLKWEYAAKAEADQKYVACNADEGDPGAFMDCSVLEGDPHVIIEAMAIAAYAIGADYGYVYVRAEYPLAVKRLQRAIDDARAYGLLGEDILGTGFQFDLEIRLGAGAFVCGEETALMRSIEGMRGEPRPRPPFPAESGIFAKPTVLNNVETYANIPQIILKGAEWFQSIGTEKSKGTKVFAVSGKINNTGLVEVPMGTALREVVCEIGGGIPNGKEFKAAQTGGPSGGCIPAKHLDVGLDYESLSALGSMMGSGGLVVMDEDNCMVDVAKFFLEFSVEESCGKCPPCRIGTKRMLEILERIIHGEGEEGDIEKLERLAKSMQTSALCALGQTAPNPVLSTIRYFRNEYEAHIRDKKCPAGVCPALSVYAIQPELCRACGICIKICPVNAIKGKRKEIPVIDTDKCIKCGACLPKCPFKAIYV